jgi:hypothetical protein
MLPYPAPGQRLFLYHGDYALIRRARGASLLLRSLPCCSTTHVAVGCSGHGDEIRVSVSVVLPPKVRWRSKGASWPDELPLPRPTVRVTGWGSSPYAVKPSWLPQEIQEEPLFCREACHATTAAMALVDHDEAPSVVPTNNHTRDWYTSRDCAPLEASPPAST